MFPGSPGVVRLSDAVPIAFPGENGRIAFEAWRDGHPQIYSMFADGSDQVNLSNNAGADQDPEWSPDRSKIAFQSNRSGSYEIWVMDANGGNQTQITNNLENDFEPAWSPDGTELVVHRGGSFVGDLWIIRADGTGERQFTLPGEGGAVHGRVPDWSTTDRIVIVSNDDGQIYAIDPDGQNLTQLTTETTN